MDSELEATRAMLKVEIDKRTAEVKEQRRIIAMQAEQIAELQRAIGLAVGRVERSAIPQSIARGGGFNLRDAVREVLERARPDSQDPYIITISSMPVNDRELMAVVSELEKIDPKGLTDRRRSPHFMTDMIEFRTTAERVFAMELSKIYEAASEWRMSERMRSMVDGDP